MLVALTGTPGTGKTSVAHQLKQKKIIIVHLNELAFSQNFIVGEDRERKSKILNMKKIDTYLKKQYVDSSDLIIVEGLASHLLHSVQKIIILRCHPRILKQRLQQKQWNQEKIRENVEAELLDIILCESVDLTKEQNIFEIDTTNLSITKVVQMILDIIEHDFSVGTKYKIGQIDWSEELIRNPSLLGE